MAFKEFSKLFVQSTEQIAQGTYNPEIEKELLKQFAQLSEPEFLEVERMLADFLNPHHARNTDQIYIEIFNAEPSKDTVRTQLDVLLFLGLLLGSVMKRNQTMAEARAIDPALFTQQLLELFPSDQLHPKLLEDKVFGFMASNPVWSPMLRLLSQDQ
ncbi:MAG TPA: hypothetical protein VD999_03390 [Vitreimonas sp.]|nr:hypothetical protein [Vitreimonas sp.]